MKIFIKKKSYFTFRNTESYSLDLLGKTTLELMTEHLCPDEGKCAGDYVVLYPVYPFLTREQLFTYLEEREGSYEFPGGYVVRYGFPMSESPRLSGNGLGRGLFSLADLPAVMMIAKRESAKYHLAKGALVEEGAEVSFIADLSMGSIVRRGARIMGRSVIGNDAEIGEGSEIEECVIGGGTVVQRSVIRHAKIGNNCTVGPFAYLRPGSEVSDGCRIGDFVELKKAKIGQGGKVSHLAYVGDAELGDRVNVGCGVVFVNYDGKKKSRTVVGDDCFIGSNCNLIAPLEIADNAFLAAGTTLTQNLQENDFCIGRCRETIKPNRAKTYYSPK